MFEWIKTNKKMVTAVGAAVAAGATALGYACPQPLADLWAWLLGVL